MVSFAHQQARNTAGKLMAIAYSLLNAPDRDRDDYFAELENRFFAKLECRNIPFERDKVFFVERNPKPKRSNSYIQVNTVQELIVVTFTGQHDDCDENLLYSYLKLTGAKVAIRICTDPEEEVPVLIRDISEGRPKLPDFLKRRVKQNRE